MAIRRTEANLPEGYIPEDFGEVVTLEKSIYINGIRNIKFVLICYLTSPIAINSKIDFVLFVEDVPEDSRENWTYNWKTIKTNSNEIVEQAEDIEEGIFSVTVDFLGQIITSVEVIYNNTEKTTLELVQEIVPLDSGLEFFLEAGEHIKNLDLLKDIGSFGGDKDVSRELINNFRLYIYEAVIQPPLITQIVPIRFLAALIYAFIMHTPKDKWYGSDRDNIIKRIAKDLCDDNEDVKEYKFDEGIGLTIILPQLLAMVVKPFGSSDPYIQWRDFDQNKSWRKNIDEISESLNELPDPLVTDAKVSFFNLLRFPKCNIKMCVLFLRRLLDREHRWNNMESDELIGKEYALKILATEYNQGPSVNILPEDEDNPKETEIVPNKFGNAVVDKLMKIPALAIYFPDATISGADSYGRYNLQRDDNDDFQKWGGIELVGPPAPGEFHFVQELKQDLSDIGFKIVGNPNGDFDIFTEWAVREFQIYASMPCIAKESGAGGNYVDRLTQALNILPYIGPKSGVVNLATRVAIQYWKANNWRCPVVIGAYNADGLFNNKYNIWKYDEVGDCHPDVNVRDFTEYYGLQTNISENYIIGMHHFKAAEPGKAPELGPVSLETRLPNGTLYLKCGHSRFHPQVKVTADRLLGKSTEELLQSYGDQLVQDYYSKLRSTFKVVHAISKVESVGYFDSINAYDNAIISMGIYHWTLGRPDLPNDLNERDGEMCAFLGFLKKENPKDYDYYFQKFGADIDKNWGDNGTDFFNSNLIKYAGWICLQNEDYSFSPIERSTNEANYLRNWHWFYRITMANRKSDAIQKLNWVFTRLRLFELITVKWEELPNPIPATSETTLLDIYTSERSISLILRAHVNYPRRVVQNGTIHNGSVIRTAVGNAVNNNPVNNPNTNFKWDQTPDNWGDEEEQALATELLSVLNTEWNNQGNFNEVNTYQWEGENLSILRNSFKFYYDNDLI